MAITVNRCLKHYRDEHVEENVIDKARIDHCIKALSPFFGRKSAEGLTTKDVKLYAGKRKRRGIGDGTIYREVSCLIAALRFCGDEKVINSIPMLRRPKKPPALDRWLTYPEASLLMENAGDRAKLYIQIATETGGRPEAIDSLKWEQVDLQQKIIYFNAEGREQTNKKRPTIPMSENLYMRLVEEKEKAKTEFVLGTDASTWKGVRGAIKRACLEGVTRKTLRHTWATWAAQAGVSLWDIAGVLGTSAATAEKNYAHHCPHHLREAVNF